MKHILIVIIMLTGFSFSGCSQSDDSRGFVVKVGDKAPDFTLSTDEGKSIILSELKGKVVMLQFTASWCGVCRKEMPFIEKEIWQEHKSDNFVVIGVDRDEPLELVKTLKQKTGITYPIALDSGAKVFGLYAKKESGITRNVIIDKDGKIVYLTRLFEREEFNEMKEVIKSLLKK